MAFEIIKLTLLTY